jgi:two-component system response regulator
MRAGHSILIIDDDIDYCCLLQLAFHEAAVANPVEAVHDGSSAVDYLRELAGGDLGRIWPGLILLDLRMPGLSGLEVLRWIRSQPFLEDVPVVVFTGLQDGKELSQSVQLGATAVREKPFSFRALIREARELRETYLEASELKHAA